MVMRRLFCLVVCTAVLCVLYCGSARASVTVSWQSYSIEQRFFENDALTPIAGSNANSSVSGFIQLIYCGLDNTYDGWTAVNDEVVSYAWMGTGVLPMNDDGRFLVSWVNTTNTPGSYFVVRFFEDPSPNIGVGAVPTTGFYGVTTNYYVTTKDPTLAELEDYTWSGTYYANTMIPEPSTLALLGLGLGVLSMRRACSRKK